MAILRYVMTNAEEVGAVTLLVLMSLASFTNVVARYVFNAPIAWGEEFSRYAFIWMVFIGAVACAKQKKHIAMENLATFLPERAQPPFFLLADFIVLSLMGVMVYYGTVLATVATQPTSTLKVPQYVIYLVVPLAGVLIGINTLKDVWRHLRWMVHPSGGRP